MVCCSLLVTYANRPSRTDDFVDSVIFLFWGASHVGMAIEGVVSVRTECYISFRFLLQCVYVSTPSVAQCNICQCLSVWLPGSCANTVWVIQASLDVVCQWIGPNRANRSIFHLMCVMLNWGRYGFPDQNLISQSSPQCITHMSLDTV